jgi:ubiquinone/menaquinone biosynthesis C-methylase UbiE
MEFNWVAEDYYQNSQFQFDHAEVALSKYTFRGNEHVLDVGCGDGKITEKIAELVPNGKVLGIDSSKPMIDFAKNEFSTKNTNLSFSVCLAENINFINEFDLIVSFACLHWVKDQLSFLKGAKKALTENGKIIITLYPKHPAIWDAIDETTNDRSWSSNFIGYSNPHISYDISLYESLVKQAELKILHLEENVPVAYFPTKKEAESFLRSWLPHTDQIHPHLRDKFITSIIELFMKKIDILDDGIIGMPFRRLDIILEK